jgi:GMP synthase (glutamine-hydrolysing)
VRELKVYCEMHSCLVKEAVLRGMNVKGIILSGGPFSVYEEGAPHLDPAVWALAAERKIPMLGICYGFQEMAHALGGEVQKAPHREYGHAEVVAASAAVAAAGGGGGGGGGGGDNGASADSVTIFSPSVDPECAQRSELLAGLPNPLKVWMSHGDKLVKLPRWFSPVAQTKDCEFAVAEGAVDPTGACGYPNRMFGLQFHPEVEHTDQGLALLKNFVLKVCGVAPNWSMASFLEGAFGVAEPPHTHPRAKTRHDFPPAPSPPPSPSPHARTHLRSHFRRHRGHPRGGG